MIVKSPINPDSYSRKLFFTSAARIAWRHLLEGLNIKAPDCVLLPSYIGFTEREGSGVFDPIEEVGTPYLFYTVTDKLAVETNELETLLEKNSVRLLLIIHYFGLCQNDMTRIAELCKAHNVLLVEDCAHAFQLGLDNQRLGAIGDFSFYSTHKYLAINSGGILQINNRSFEFEQIAERDQPSLAVLEQHIKTDIRAVAEVRRQNYRTYEMLLQDASEVEIMFELSASDVPHNFPIKVKNGLREKLYFYLMNAEIPTIALYYRLIDEIKKDEFPASFRVSDEILNLPVHQDTMETDVHRVCEFIKRFYRS